MNDLMKFVNNEFGSVRGYNINGIPYLVGKDIAILLGYENCNRDIVRHVDNEDRIMLNKAQYQNGIKLNYRELGQRGGWLINESGFYSLVFGSELKTAKRFKKWVTSEVLPQIRQTGGYIPIKEEEPNEVFLARAVQVANETIKQKDVIIANQKKRIESLEETEKDWKLIMDCKGTFSVNEIAHFIGIGEYKLFARMREMGILFKNENNDNVVYEKPVHKGKFICVPAIAPDGTAHLQTRVYPEGISYITKLLRKYGYLEVA